MFGTYLGMQAICPSIKQPGFRWEQIDYWNIAIQYREIPDIIIGGSKAKYNPGVSGCATNFRHHPKELLWFLPVALCIDLPIVWMFNRVLYGYSVGEPEANSLMILVVALVILLIVFLVNETKSEHKGSLVSTDRVD